MIKKIKKHVIKKKNSSASVYLYFVPTDKSNSVK